MDRILQIEPAKPASWTAMLLVLAGLCTPVLGVNAPDTSRRLSEFVQVYLGLEQGLPQNTVMTIAQDPKGYIWVGTFEGLARFDGKHFHPLRSERFPGLNRSTTQILFEPDGTQWAGTQTAGLFRIRPGEPIQQFTRDDGLLSDRIWSLFRDREDQLWVGTQDGLCLWRFPGFDCDIADGKIPRSPVTALAQGVDGALWIGQEGGGLSRLDGSRFDHWDEVEGRSIRRISDLAVGSDGALWMGTFGSGLVRLKDDRFDFWTTGEGLASNLVRTLLVDALDTVWIGTYGAGLQRLLHGRLERLEISTGLPDDHIQSITVDREGTLWFGTAGGLNRLHGARFVTISTREGLSGPFVRSVVQDLAGNLWVGTDSDGLNRLLDGQVVEALRRDEIGSDSIRSLWPAADGGLWIGAYGAQLTYRSVTGETRSWGADQGLASPLIRALFEDSRGTLWVGTERNGLHRLSDGVLEHFSEATGLPHNAIRAIAEAPDGSIWLGTYGGGVARQQGDGFVAVPGLAEAIVFALLFEADGGVWVGADDGLRFVGPDGLVQEFAHHNELDNAMFRLLEDRSGLLWMCTNHGVLSVDKSALRNGGSPAVTRYDTADGLRSRQCNGASQPAGWADRQGLLWFPTADGVSFLDPQRLAGNPVPPPVVFNSITVDDRLLSELPAELVLEPGTQRLEVDYAALTYVAPEQVRFRYRLEGLDGSWVDAGDRTQAFYNNLPAGRYTLQVIAANADGVWNTEGARLLIWQQPRIWETGWFRVSAIASLLLVVAGMMRWRSLGLQRQKARLEDEVRERTRDLRQTLEELQDTQAQLIEAEKMAALGSLVAGVAHEVNTPLGNSVTVASHLLDRCETLAQEVRLSDADPNATESFQQGLAVILENLERAGAVVNTFKQVDVSQDKRQRRSFLLGEVLNDAVLNFAPQIQEMGHHLEVVCPENLAMNSYPKALYDLFAQLTENSLDHAFRDPGGEISIRAQDLGDHVAIDYRDNGPGINEEDRARLFEPFFTGRRSRGHSGLGLHIAFNIVTRLLGGKISSPDGAGARFRIVIPKTAPL